VTLASSDDRVQLVPDGDGRGGVSLLVEGTPQSHVDLNDPEHLAFEYVQHLAALIDLLPAGALAVTHVGGAAMTLPRYVNATRPGSPQIVLEPDTALTELVRRELPLPRRHRIRVRPIGGLDGVRALADAGADVVVVDAYSGGRVPAELTTREFLSDIARVVRPSGCALLNLADEPGLSYVGRVLAGLRCAFNDVAVVAAQEVLKGRRFGNVVVAASREPLGVAAMRRRAAGMPFPTAVWHGEQLARRFRHTASWTVGDSSPSPPPPSTRGWRVR